LALLGVARNTRFTFLLGGLLCIVGAL